MKRSILPFLVLILTVAHGWADPADPNIRRTIHTNDGKAREVRLVGDEYGHYWQSTDDGLCFIEKNGRDDAFESIDPAVVRQRARKLRQEASTTSSAFPHTHLDLTGEKRMLVVLVQFKDVKFKAENKKEWYDDILNRPNYVVPSAHQGSVYDYFLAQSGGKLHLCSDIIGPVTVSHNSAYYGADSELGKDTKVVEMVTEALSLIEGKVDFGRYDWTGSNIVETVFFIFAGKPQSGGGTVDDIWPHKCTINLRLGNITVRNYACASELRRYGSVFKINSIGTFCHEMSHCFGLPDTYDPAGVNYGTVIWDVMGTGCHNNYGYTPAGYTAYNKMFCQWQAPVVLRNDTVVNAMKPISEGGDFYLIPNDAHEDEFYLLENRQKTGWDAQLSGHGMLITHVDYDPKLFTHSKINQCGIYDNDHERIHLVLADNNTNVTSGNATQKALDYQGDLFPYGTNKSLTNTSTPAAELYHVNIDDSYLLGKPITNIHENSNKSMGFTFRNNISKMGAVFLNHSDDSIKHTSDTSARLSVQLKNHAYSTYNNKVYAYICDCQDGLHANKISIFSKKMAIAPKAKERVAIDLNNLNSDADYHVLFYYLRDGSHQTLMGTPITLDMKSIYDFSLVDEGRVLNVANDAVRINVRLRNNSYKKYDYPVAAYLYRYTENGDEQKLSKTLVTKEVAPGKEASYSFLFDGLNSHEDYYAILCYHNDRDGKKWQQIGEEYPIYIEENTIIFPGDVDNNGTIDVTDVMKTVDIVLGKHNINFYEDHADLNNDCLIDVTDIMHIVDIILKK